ncbi:dihydrodipicolinate synthetase (plasmid) [Gemmatirosa kalamazoonensis]|uniref:Dihydrodipicolinate synthetase n=2 Tax=Gemmatirosa kalamazoonensis TaxID=861299 RepID=W0RNV2_9BACT|nr:dihydrodipicolinate synthetase [Gemmatirosa kalamazoonensis]
MPMEQPQWTGVIPAITTPLRDDFTVDHAALADHVNWLVDSGCTGIVTGGSLGEAATLSFEEKVAVNETCVRTLAGRVPVVAGIAGLATAECVALARAAEQVGCDGIMALPAYVYYSDWPEAREHYSAIINATGLSCMLYNNPIAYRTDVLPEQLAELAERHENLHAVKESSGDVRRVTAVREALGDRLAVFAGLDDMIVEAVAMGAAGWIAGLVNALPVESVRVYELARDGRWAEAHALYHWFLPLLRMDTVPKFVQLIKLVQAEVGRGTETVRPPRLPLEGAERDEALKLVRERLASRPPLPNASAHGASNGQGGSAKVAAGR